MKRPGGAARKLPGEMADATKKKAKKNHASSNLLGNILGNIKKKSEQQLQQHHRASNGKTDGKPLPRIERSSLMTPQERALERRKKFEKEIKEKIEKEVVEKWTASEGKETASFRCVLFVWGEIISSLTGRIRLPSYFTHSFICTMTTTVSNRCKRCGETSRTDAPRRCKRRRNRLKSTIWLMKTETR
jgi:hypothetical protein